MFVGVIPLFSVNATVLFDSGASHSFMAQTFVLTHHLKTQIGTQEWNIHTPTGGIRVSNKVCRNCPLEIGHLILSANLVVIDMNDFDIILGMDWLSKHHAFIDCRKKTVCFKISGEELCYYQGIQSRTPKAIHTKLGCQLT